MATVRHRGLYRKDVVLLTNQPIKLGAGAQDNYVELYIGRGYLKIRANGGRVLQTGEIVQNNQYDLFILYGTLRELDKIETKLRPDSKMRIGDKLYTVSSWDNVGERNFELHFVINAQ